MDKETAYNYEPLKEPVSITEQVWPEETLPLVHTRTMAFMHEDYIIDCIEGILMQKTTFPVQVLIHDDASTDKTAEIIKEYQNKYPKLIKAFYQIENSHSKPNKDERRMEFFSWRIGKYEATCEGDDYWIDPYKLQKQVEFLEQNTNYSAVFGQVIQRNEKNGFERIGRFNKKDYTMFDVLSGLMPGMQNICIRTEISKFIPDIKSNGDYKIYYACAKWGPLGYIDELTSVYRLTGKGASSGRPAEKVLEIAINHRFEFHKQLGFPDNKALVLSQVKTFLTHLYMNFSINQIIKTLKLLKKYKVPNIWYYPLYPYYSITFILGSIFQKIIRENI